VVAVQVFTVVMFELSMEAGSAGLDVGLTDAPAA
jgi:hypothetical protein